jgi:glycosyltransferase involved in cell wall biosynthesis
MSRAINVLVIQPYRNVFGPHQVMYRIVRKLHGERYHFSVITPGNGPAADLFRALSVDVIYIPEATALYRTSNPLQLVSFAARLIVGAPRVAAYIRTRGIHLVHSITAQCWIGGIAARLAGVPSIYHVHDVTLGSPKPVGWLMAQMINLTSDRILFVSEAARRALPLPSGAVRKARVVYNGVDSNEFRPGLPAEAVRLELGLQPGQRLVAAIGDLEERKGQEYLVRVCVRVREVFPDIRFLFVGDVASGGRQIDYDQRVKNLARELGVEANTLFVGRRSDIPSLLNAVDLVVQPSLIEAFPLAVLEAGACGVPVVASATGGLLEIIADGETGLLVPPGDVKALAEAILALLGDGSRRRAMGVAARQRIERLFDLSKHIDVIAATYENVITGS